MNISNLRENMLITKITPSINLQSKPDLKRADMTGSTYSLFHRQQEDRTFVAMPYYQPSFGSIKIPPVAEALERKGVKLAKKYLIDSDEKLSVVIDAKTGLGEKPVFCWAYLDEEQVISKWRAEGYGIDSNYKSKWVEMMYALEKRGDIYEGCPGASECAEKVNYAVYYQDTKKWDDNCGQGYEIDPRKIISKAALFDKKEHGQSMFRIIRSGSVKGKVICCPTLAEFLRDLPKSDEPIIAVVEDFNSKDCIWGTIPPNVRGVVFTKTSEGSLGHVMASVRAETEAAALVYEEKEVEALHKMAGKFIHLDVDENGFKWHQIEESEVEASKVARPVIQIPEIRTTDKLLTSAEYEPDIVGPKAYNLRRLEEIKQRGGLKDVEIPRSFAIPCGVYEKVLTANPETTGDIAKRISEVDEMTDPNQINKSLNRLRGTIYSSYNPKSLKIPEEIQKEIMDFKAKFGLRDVVMVRSAFNGEDAGGYSAAGLYKSKYCDKHNDPKAFFDKVQEVWLSKWDYGAYMSRKTHNIDHSKIKPTVVIQDYVNADYNFTLYTKSPESKDGNKIYLQLAPRRSIEPYVIKYDRDTHEVEVESIARRGRKITLDEDMNVVDAEPINDPIKNDLERWKAKLKKVCEAALEVEQEFGAPQDIEGGIKFTKDGDVDTSQIYFWQAREQVL